MKRHGTGMTLHRALRYVAYAILPAELALLCCLLAGATLPRPLVFAVEAGVALSLAVETAGLLLLYRRGGAGAVKDVVPEPVRRLVGHEVRVLTSLALWPARHRYGVRPGIDQAFGHARGQTAPLLGLAFVCAAETWGMAMLLRPWPVAHYAVLAVDVYTLVLVLGMHAASVTRPHVLSPGELRIRHGAHRDLRIPLERIASVRDEPRYAHEAVDGVLNITVAARTSLTLELSEPVIDAGLLGKRRAVTTVRLHADEPAELLAALRDRLPRAHADAGRTVTRA